MKVAKSKTVQKLKDRIRQLTIEHGTEIKLHKNKIHHLYKIIMFQQRFIKKNGKLQNKMSAL